MLGETKRDRIAERREATRREILDAAWRLAREQGLTGFTLGEVAQAVGMRTPSLYSHVESKLAVYDLMFGEAWAAYDAQVTAQRRRLPREARARLRRMAASFFDFSTADPARYQLMNQRIIPGFVPSPEAYAPSLAVMGQLVEELAGLGVTRRADVDLYVALVGGLVESQLANDPGGRRWRRLVPRAMDMYADAVGL